MKKKLNLLLLSIFFIGSSFLLGKSISFAQETVELQGYMGVQGGELFNIKLELYQEGPNKWSGFSYTYDQIDKAVKAAIDVEIAADRKSMTIIENQLIYNHGFKSKATICLMLADLKVNEDYSELKGSLETRTDIQRSLCARGTLTFMQKEEIKKLLLGTKKEIKEEAPIAVASVEPVATTPKKEPGTQPIATKPGGPNGNISKAKLSNHFKSKEQQNEFRARQEERRAARLAENKPEQSEITEGRPIEIIIENDEIEFFVWDGGKIDYDRVSVYVNDEKVLDNYTLTAQPHKVVIPAMGKRTVVKILALNEGGEPPNTADIAVKDGKDVHHILAHNTISKYSEIILIKR